MLRSRPIPRERVWDDGAVTWAPPGCWVPPLCSLQFIPPLSPSFSSPFPFSSFPAALLPTLPLPAPLLDHTSPRTGDLSDPAALFKSIQEAPGAPAHQIKLKFAAYMQTRCVWTPRLRWHTQQVNRNTWAEPGRETARARSFGEGFEGVLGRDLKQQHPEGESPIPVQLHGHCQAQFPRLAPWQGCS